MWKISSFSIVLFNAQMVQIFWKFGVIFAIKNHNLKYLYVLIPVEPLKGQFPENVHPLQVYQKLIRDLELLNIPWAKIDITKNLIKAKSSTGSFLRRPRASTDVSQLNLICRRRRDEMERLLFLQSTAILCWPVV